MSQNLSAAVSAPPTASGESKFDGKVLSYLGWSILAGLITICTFGICFPWAFCLFYSWKTSSTVINGKRLKFNGSGGSLFVNWIKWWLLCIVTLGIYSFWLFVAFEKWKVKNTTFVDE
ncbi:MAG: DUF898 domain-containing protein [Chitinispirillales bacterium]|jgi:uncharacterized membrane protein YjgN (DUF898 family)|nr:DUF898 domain-containing protein [Chitinispirillales bacterium]